jgi:sugar phosphate isomerase/epimerase
VNISVASYAFYGLVAAKTMDVFGYLESSKYRYGLDRADIWNGMLASYEPEYLALVKEALDERELTLANLCVDQAHIWDDDAAVRERNQENAQGALRAAVQLGARTLRMDAGGRADTWTDEQFALIVARYQEWAQYAADHGFRVGPENHWGAENVPSNMVKLCQAVDHPGFGVLLHHKNLENDRTFARWAMHTHMSWEWCTGGQLEAGMAMLIEAGYRGCWGIEHHSGRDEYSQVGLQVALVREVLERWRVVKPA